MHTTLTTMREDIEVNGQTYPMYLGFASSTIINEIADVPNFDENARHEDLAKELLTPPIRSWQRPFMQQKIDDIAKIYSDTDKTNLMPNPIILSTNPLEIGSEGMGVRPSVMRIPTENNRELEVPNLYDIDVTYSGGKPLWILDGQHRTFGMRETGSNPDGEDRSDLPIPFILLHGDSYTPPMLAEIFTYVTSGAKEMDPIHKYWMHYSFKIGKHASDDIQRAMEATIALCESESFNSDHDDEEGSNHHETIFNIFRNKIKFNPRDDDFVGFHSFNFACSSLSDLIAKNYYSGNSDSLDSQELAAQICFSIKAFYDLDQHKSELQGGSVLFDSNVAKGRQLQRLATAFTTSVLDYLKTDCPSGMSYAQWKTHLSDKVREFDRNDWSIPRWRGGGLDGATGNRSQKLAIRVFSKYLRMTPEDHEEINHTRIIDYLWGTGRKIRITAFAWNDSNNRIINRTRGDKPKLTRAFDGGGGQMHTFNLGQGDVDRIAIKVEADTDCVDIIKVIDGDRLPMEDLPNAKLTRAQNIVDQLDRERPGSKDKLKIWVITEAWSTATKVEQEFELSRY